MISPHHPSGNGAPRNSTAAERLRIPPKSRILLWKAPPGAREALDPLPADCRVIARQIGHFDVVILYPPDRPSLEAVATTIGSRVGPRGLIWVAFETGQPVGSPRPTRDECRDVLEAAGFHAIAQVALEPGWSALRVSATPADRVSE